MGHGAWVRAFAGTTMQSNRHCEPTGRANAVVVSGFDVIARSVATKQSILSFRGGNGLLRGACHRARIRATRWLAMTVLKRSCHALILSSPAKAGDPVFQRR